MSIIIFKNKFLKIIALDRHVHIVRQRLRASALFFTIIISLVIALLCSSLIFIAYFHKAQVQQNQLKERLIRNAKSAIQLMLSSNWNGNSLQYIDLYGDYMDSVLIRKDNWGLYEIGHVKAICHKDTVSRTFMLGTVPDSIWKSALYLLDQGYPVTFAGNTLVKGSAYLPAAGVTRGAIDSKDFSRKKLIDGETRKSSNKLPDLNDAYLKKMLLQTSYMALPNDLSTKTLKKDSLIVSFSQPTIRIHSKGIPIYLSNIILKGNIIISSDTLIEIASSANLEHILLTAPKVIFKDDFKGTVQAFATDTLITGEDSHFSYPSALVLLETDSIDNQAKLIISKNCKFEGVALLYVSFLDRSQATIKISKGTEFSGQVYAQGWTIHEGKISGTLVANKFLLKASSGLYENHLLDCIIDRTTLSSFFLGSPLFNNSRRNIAKWLE